MTNNIQITKEQILEAFPKPSDVVLGMVPGLLEWSQKDNHAVDMGTFGTVRGIICVGCAATATMLWKFPQLPVQGLDRRWFGLVAGTRQLQKDLRQFEYMLDDFRRGNRHELGFYYGVELPPPSFQLVRQMHPHSVDTRLPRLDTNTWEEHLPSYEAYGKELQAAGL